MIHYRLFKRVFTESSHTYDLTQPILGYVVLINGVLLDHQVITEFCKSIGADAKQRQGLIRLAKKNGEKLGFLA